jgi:2'-5' RNA ligase
MIIKKFENFLLFLEKDSSMYEFGCLMVYLNIPRWQDFLKKIDSSDLYQTENDRYGVETEPHCTILYGVHSDVDDDEVLSLFEGLKKSDFDIYVNGIDCFFNQEYDVLKLNILSSKLHELNELSKSLPYTNQYKDYKPHITLAYLQKGNGSKYVDPTFKANINNSIDRIVYSKSNGEKIDIPLL